MKKIFGLIVVVGIGYGIWYLSNKTASTSIPLSNTPIVDSTSSTTHPDASNGTFVFEDASVKLKNGSFSQTVASGSASSEETTLTSTVGYGDLNKDNKEDAVVALMQNSGGTGTFIYISGYVSSPTGYKGTNAVFVGDRIQPKSITIENGEVTFTYLDRKPDEPMDAEPTVSAYKSFVYSKGVLVEKN
ncbi:hypothetical protein BH11PAT3_BH11PAT3_1960 [soil metagenome]